MTLLSYNYYSYYIHNKEKVVTIDGRKQEYFLTNFVVSLAQQPNAGQGRLIREVSRPHTMTHHRL